MEVISAVATVFLILVAAYGGGTAIRRWLPRGLAAWEAAILQCLWGMGALGLLLFLVGLARFDRTVILTVLIPAACIGCADLWRQGVPGPRLDTLSFTTKSLLLFSGAVILLLWIASIAEPLGSVDHIRYHLLDGKVWLRDGYVHPLPENLHTAFPATLEMLFAAGTAVSSPRTGGQLSVMIAVLLIAQVAGITRRLRGSQEVSALAMALCIVLPAITPTVVWAFVDVFVAALSLGLLRVLMEAESPRHFAVAGCYAGFLAGTKYTGLLILAITTALLLFAGPIRFPYAVRFRNALILAGIGTLIGCPWYVRNAVQLGCPVYPPTPLLARFCNPRYLSPDAVVKFHNYILNWNSGRLGRSLVQLLLLPIRLSFQRWWVGDNWWGELGTVPLALGPLGLFASIGDRRGRFLAIWSAAVTLSWFWTEQEIRFLQSAILLWIVFGVLAAALLLRSSFRWGRYACVLTLAVSLIEGGIQAATMHFRQVRRVLDPGLAALAHVNDTPNYGEIQYLNSHPDVGKVLIVDPLFKLYYLNRPYVQWEGENGERPLATATFAETLKRVGEMGITHVLVHNDSGPEIMAAIRGCSAAEPVFSSKNATIYAVHVNR